MRPIIVLAGLVLTSAALAQTSTSFTLEEYTLNAGVVPRRVSI